MRTREKNFVDTTRMRTVYSFQVHWDGRWHFVSKGGELLKFETQAEVDAARAEYRRKLRLW